MAVFGSPAVPEQAKRAQRRQRPADSTLFLIERKGLLRYGDVETDMLQKRIEELLGN